MCAIKYEKLVKLKELDKLLIELHDELTDDNISECSETIAISDMIWKAQERIAKEIVAEQENNKLDSHVYIIIQKIKNYRKEEVILNVFNECFSDYDKAVSYIQGHYKAKRRKKHYTNGWQLVEEFENEDFIYQIRKINIVSKYEYDNDRIIYREDK